MVTQLMMERNKVTHIYELVKAYGSTMQIRYNRQDKRWDRAEALVEMAKNTFRFREHPRRGLEVLSDVLRDVECARLVVGDLEAACQLVDDLMGGSPR